MNYSSLKNTWSSNSSLHSSSFYPYKDIGVPNNDSVENYFAKLPNTYTLASNITPVNGLATAPRMFKVSDGIAQINEMSQSYNCNY